MELQSGFEESLAGLGAEGEGLAEALRGSGPAVSVRVNRAKADGALRTLGLLGDGAVEWCPEGMYLIERPQFTLDPLFHAGCYYVQDASSMFISHVLRHLTHDTAPLMYLDACASPGGKTTAAIDALPAGSLVVANEFDYRRAAILCENIIKWGYPDVMVTRGDTRRLRESGVAFDIIAADVPCSGEGMMRKDAGAVAQWSPSLVEQCAELQRAILDNLVPILRPGGYMIYSTCTFNTLENERNVEYLMREYSMEPVAIPTGNFHGIAGAAAGDMPVFRFMPHRVRGEGLFMAVLQKPYEAEAPRQRKLRDKRGNGQIPAAAHQLLADNTRNHTLSVDADVVRMVPRRNGTARRLLAAACDVILDGVAVGTVKGRDFVPSHHLCMSPGLLAPEVPRIELDRTTALNYLRREAVELPGDTPRGYVVATYGGHPLGWLKNMSTRANNLYPAEYRIRTL